MTSLGPQKEIQETIYFFIRKRRGENPYL